MTHQTTERLKLWVAERPLSERLVHIERDRPRSDESVGYFLRVLRQEKGLPVADVASDLRIQARFIEAIEAEDWSALPGRAYTIGYVRSYAEHLGADPEHVVERLKADGALQTGRPALRFPEPASERHMPLGAVISLSLCAVIGGYMFWYFNNAQTHFQQEEVPPVPARLAALMTPEDPPVADDRPSADWAASSAGEAKPRADAGDGTVLASDAGMPSAPAPDDAGQGTAALADIFTASHGVIGVAPAVVMQDAEDAKVADLQLPSAPGAEDEKTGGYRGIPAHAAVLDGLTLDGHQPIVLMAEDTSWIEVRSHTTGQRVASRLMRAGEAYRVPTNPDYVLTTGNAGGTSLIVGGRKLPPLGNSGEVVRNISLDVTKLQQQAANLAN